MKNVIDKRLICVIPCNGLAMNEEYRAIQKDDNRYMVMDSNGSYVWRNKTRFVEKGE